LEENWMNIENYILDAVEAVSGWELSRG